jgi:hypothetical protein
MDQDDFEIFEKLKIQLENEAITLQKDNDRISHIIDHPNVIKKITPDEIISLNTAQRVQIPSLEAKIKFIRLMISLNKIKYLMSAEAIKDVYYLYVGINSLHELVDDMNEKLYGAKERIFEMITAPRSSIGRKKRKEKIKKFSKELDDLFQETIDSLQE